MFSHIERVRRRCNIPPTKEPRTGCILCAVFFFDSVVMDSLSNGRKFIRTLSNGSDKLHHCSLQILKKADLLAKSFEFSHGLPSIRAPPKADKNTNQHYYNKEKSICLRQRKLK